MLPQQPTPYQSDVQPLPPRAFLRRAQLHTSPRRDMLWIWINSRANSTSSLLAHKISLIPDHALMVPLVVPRFFPVTKDENKLEPNKFDCGALPNCGFSSPISDFLGTDEFVIENDNSSIIGHGGFTTVKSIITDYSLSSCYGASGLSLSEMLEIFDATERALPLPWKELHVYCSSSSIIRILL